MRRNELLSKASEFVSFLLRNNKSSEIDGIILFGSVARGDFDAESDIDLFVDTKNKKLKEFVEKQLRLYEKSENYRKWVLKNVNNQLVVKVGVLEEWEELHRSITSNGITLYGKYEKLPKNLRHFYILKLNFSKHSRSKKVSLWRGLYGYSQKVGKKTYNTKGVLTDCEGVRIGKSIIMLPNKHYPKIKEFLKRKSIQFKVYEIYSDNF
jgi:predicted nucleotidyltransferase